MRNPEIYKASDLQKWNCATEKNGRYIPARPLGWQGLRLDKTFQIAFYVLIGKYDALDWEDGE